MDSIRVSEAPDPGSIPGEATFKKELKRLAGTSEQPDLPFIILPSINSAFDYFVLDYNEC